MTYTLLHIYVSDYLMSKQNFSGFSTSERTFFFPFLDILRKRSMLWIFKSLVRFGVIRVAHRECRKNLYRINFPLPFFLTSRKRLISLRQSEPCPLLCPRLDQCWDTWLQRRSFYSCEVRAVPWQGLSIKFCVNRLVLGSQQFRLSISFFHASESLNSSVGTYRFIHSRSLPKENENRKNPKEQLIFQGCKSKENFKNCTPSNSSIYLTRAV